MATSDDDLALAGGDFNRAALLFLNAFYGTAETDVNRLLQKFLADKSATSPAGNAGTANDSTRAWDLLQRAIAGKTS